MTSPALNLCKLCLFKSEPIDEICIEESELLAKIIEDMFHHMVSMTRLQIDGICIPCRSKLKAFYEYYKFVLENQNIYESHVENVQKQQQQHENQMEFIEICKSEEKSEVKLEMKSDHDDGDDDSDERQSPDPENDEPETKIETDSDYVDEVDEKQTPDDDEIGRNKKRTNFHRGNLTKKRPRISRAHPDTIEKWKLANEKILASKLFNFVCIKCPAHQEFPTYEAITEHTRKFHRKAHTWNCCDRVLKTRMQLLVHIDEHNGEPKWRCKDCGEIFRNGREHRSHWSKTHRKCEICKLDKIKKETYFSHMQRHLLSKVPGKLAKYTCDICKKTLKDRYGLKKHMENFHLGLTRHVCEICGANSVSQSALSHHIQNVHSKEDKKKTRCPICGIMLRDVRYKIQEHIRNVHQEKKPVSCDICNITLKHAGALKSHKRRQHSINRNQCRFCSKTFVQKRSLLDHEAVHTGISQYFCEFCNAQFKSSGNFLAHKRRLHPLEYAKQKEETRAKKYV